MRLHLIASTRFSDAHALFLEQRSLCWKEASASTDSERLIEFAGRVCYLSFGERQSDRNNADYIGNLIRQGHGSVLEHASVTILADEVSRALTHQLVRHRVGFSYSQLSQQYHDESNADFVLPDGIDESHEIAEQWKSSLSAAKKTYRDLLERLDASEFARKLGAKERLRAIRSIARTVLPNATMTILVMTGNLRAWRHLLEVRGAIEGDLEMRKFCAKCFALLKEEAPSAFQDFEVVEDPMGSFVKRQR